MISVGEQLETEHGRTLRWSEVPPLGRGRFTAHPPVRDSHLVSHTAQARRITRGADSRTRGYIVLDADPDVGALNSERIIHNEASQRH